VITTSLMPLEIYEIVKHSTTAKIVPMLLNIAVVAYLDRGRAAGGKHAQ